MAEYIYKGDRLTNADFKNKHCVAIKKDDGKCIRGKNGNMLVYFPGLKIKAIILAKRLRKIL